MLCVLSLTFCADFHVLVFVLCVICALGLRLCRDTLCILCSLGACLCAWIAMDLWLYELGLGVTFLRVFYLLRPNQGEYVDLVLIDIIIYILGYSFMVGLSVVHEN